jgi:predicted TIM-barrel fold metal-dependent hydrolase
VRVLREVTQRRGAAFERRLFHDNAARFFGL